MIRALALCALVALPQGAAALSCLRPDVARSYAEADAAEAGYIVVTGRLHFDPSAVPRAETGDETPPQLTLIPARLTGRALTSAGFSRPFDGAVMLEVECAGPWCASPKPGDVLAFVRSGDNGLRLSVGPCGGRAFFEPTKDQIRTVEACHRDGTCTKE